MTYWNAMFKEWQEMQQSFIDNLPMKLPGVEYQTQSTNPWELPHLQTFMSWGQSAVKQSLELQTHWLDQWSSQMDQTIATSNESKTDMVSRIHESMNGWSENQSELWEYWFKMVEESADTLEDPTSLYENINSWKSTVEESLTSQTDWLERWSKDLNIEELTPEELLNVSTKIQETMNGWLELQGELWHKWFEFLSINEIAMDGAAAVPTPAKAKPSRAKPAKVKAKAKPAKKKAVSKKPARKAAKSSTKKRVKDNLELISGIGPALAKKLYAQGIVNFRQIADLTEKEIDKLEKTTIKFPGRIRREKWVAQAAKILKNAGK